MSAEDVVSVKEHSLSDYLKKAEVNSNRVLNVFVKEKGKQELETERNKMKFDKRCDKPLHEQCP